MARWKDSFSLQICLWKNIFNSIWQSMTFVLRLELPSFTSKSHVHKTNLNKAFRRIFFFNLDPITATLFPFKLNLNLSRTEVKHIFLPENCICLLIYTFFTNKLKKFNIQKVHLFYFKDLFPENNMHKNPRKHKKTFPHNI